MRAAAGALVDETGILCRSKSFPRINRRNVTPDPLPSGTELIPLIVRQSATYRHLGGLTSVPRSEEELSSRKHAEHRKLIFREPLEEFRRTLLPCALCIPWEHCGPPPDSDRHSKAATLAVRTPVAVGTQISPAKEKGATEAAPLGDNRERVRPARSRRPQPTPKQAPSQCSRSPDSRGPEDDSRDASPRIRASPAHRLQLVGLVLQTLSVADCNRLSNAHHSRFSSARRELYRTPQTQHLPSGTLRSLQARDRTCAALTEAIFSRVDKA